MIEFCKYAKVKDRFCLCYFGPLDEYLIQLRLLKPVIERHFTGIQLILGCRDDKACFLEGSGDIMKITQIKERAYDFGYVREIKFNGKDHPIEELMQESEIENYAVRSEPPTSNTNRCVIITKGSYPTKTLEVRKIEALKKLAIQQGYEPHIDVDVDGAGMIVGVESLELFQAAGRGIRTILVPTGLGTRLYSKMFPENEVMA